MRRALILLLLFIIFSSPIARADDWIVDTDVAVDDALALLFMMSEPTVVLKAITIESDGMARCGPAFANVQSLITLTHHRPIPVACGRDEPLRGDHRFPANLVKASDTLAGTTHPQPPYHEKYGAKELLTETLRTAPHPMNILAIGPLTTIAEAIQKDPGIIHKINKIVIMGGALNVPGNVHAVDPTQANTVAEWNFYIDPLAAKTVIESRRNIVLVPLDLTNQVLLDEPFYSALAKRQASPTGKFAFQLLNHQKEMITSHQWYFWDTMAAAIAANESLADCRLMPIRVLEQPDNQAGQTIVDPKHGFPIHVCTGIDKNRFKEYFLIRVSG